MLTMRSEECDEGIVGGAVESTEEDEEASAMSNRFPGRKVMILKVLKNVWLVLRGSLA